MLPEYIKWDIIKKFKYSTNESCGLVVQDQDKTLRFQSCKNISPEPKHSFIIDPKDYANIEDSCYRVLFIVHNHPSGGDFFSQTDLDEISNSYIPWVLLTSSNTFIYNYSMNYSTLLGKQFKVNKQDCLTTVLDYYRIFQDINISVDVERPLGWWDKEDLIIDNLDKYPFYSVDLSDCLPGDIFLMAYDTPRISHFAVYIGEGKIIHHCRGMLSRVQECVGPWKESIKRVMRHNDNNY